MQHKGGISYYMQKIRFFAAMTVGMVFILSQLPATETVSAHASAIPSNIPRPAETISLPVTKTDISSVTAVIPGGDAIALRLTCDGVIVLGFTDENRDNPARAAGLKRGDRIIRVGDTKIDGNQALSDALNRLGGNAISLKYVRDNKEYETTLCPRKNDDGTWQMGVLIKDSTAGIGTLTYVIPGSGEYGCLGHGISDPDTDTLFCVGKGDLYPAQITNLRKGQCGTPGELQGMFGYPALGRCVKNCETGLFGQLDATKFQGRDTLPIASKSEVREGNAVIRCTIDDDDIEEYDIEIVRIYRAFGGPTKNMLIRVTDPELLEQTGGIVQGMSGSPIIQNGKLIGAVTHVLINDPTSGYGIFIENMLNSAA